MKKCKCNKFQTKEKADLREDKQQNEIRTKPKHGQMRTGQHSNMTKYKSKKRKIETLIKLVKQIKNSF